MTLPNEQTNTSAQETTPLLLPAASPPSMTPTPAQSGAARIYDINNNRLHRFNNHFASQLVGRSAENILFDSISLYDVCALLNYSVPALPWVTTAMAIILAGQAVLGVEESALAWSKTSNKNRQSILNIAYQGCFFGGGACLTVNTSLAACANLPSPWLVPVPLVAFTCGYGIDAINKALSGDLKGASRQAAVGLTPAAIGIGAGLVASHLLTPLGGAIVGTAAATGASLITGIGCGAFFSDSIRQRIKAAEEAKKRQGQTQNPASPIQNNAEAPGGHPSDSASHEENRGIFTRIAESLCCMG